MGIVAHRRRLKNAMFKALARAFRWQKMLKTGQYATIKEIAAAERINPSYVSRVLRLTLLRQLLWRPFWLAGEPQI